MLLLEDSKLKDIIYQNELLIVVMSSSMEKTIDSDIKRYEEIRKLTTGQGEDYTTGCLLDYDYIKNHYRLMAVDLSRQKVLDAYPKSIQQIEFVGQLKKVNNAINNPESIFILMILEKIKEKRLKLSQGSLTVWWKIANYQEATVKLTNTQLNRLKSAAVNKTGTILRLNKKNFEDEESPHEFFQTTRQTTKLRNVNNANNMLTDIKLSKAQISKIIQSE